MIAKYWRIFFICAIVAFSYMFTFYMGYVFAVEIFEIKNKLIEIFANSELS